MCPGVDSASKNEYQDLPVGKDGRCVRVTTLPPSCAECLNLPETPKSRSGITLPFTEWAKRPLAPGQEECRNVAEVGKSYMSTYSAFFRTVFYALLSNNLPSRQKSLLIAVTLSLTCNFLLRVLQGLFTHPVLSYCILLGILPTCITFPLLEGFPISFLGLPSGIYIAS
jgi:hypothetical protein